MQCCNAGICYLLVLARLSDLQTDWQVDCSGSRGNRFSWIPWTCRIVDGFVGHTQVRWSWLFLWVLSADSSTKQILSPIITELPYTCFVCQSLLFEFSMQEISLEMSVTSGFVLRKLWSVLLFLPTPRSTEVLGAFQTFWSGFFHCQAGSGSESTAVSWLSPFPFRQTDDLP